MEFSLCQHTDCDENVTNETNIIMLYPSDFMNLILQESNITANQTLSKGLSSIVNFYL